MNKSNTAKKRKWNVNGNSNNNAASTTASHNKNKRITKSTRKEKRDALDDDFLMDSDSELPHAGGASSSSRRGVKSALLEADEEENELDGAQEDHVEDGMEDGDHETPDERRLRLAKQLLEKVGMATDELSENEAGIEDPIAHRLQQDVLKEQGRLKRKVAHKLSELKVSEDSLRILRGHRLSVTAVCISHDDTTAYSASKDGSIIKWDIENGKKLFTIHGVRGTKSLQGHTDEVLALSVSSDGALLASGGRDKVLRLWDTRTNKMVQSFPGHRDSITGLAFRTNTRDLFSCSMDRTVKVWNMEQLAYVETLFGHQNEITGIDSLYQHRAVTAGSDRTVRVWKIIEETQLVYKGQEASIDCVSMVNEDLFLTGSQDGSIAFWNTRKKKPVHIVNNAHSAQWITSVAAQSFSDLVASGSSDGFVRLWSCEHDHLSPLLSVPVVGFVNSLAFAKSGRFLIAGIGQEHKLGRWSRLQAARNGIQLIPLVSDGSAFRKPKKSSTAVMTV